MLAQTITPAELSNIGGGTSNTYLTIANAETYYALLTDLETVNDKFIDYQFILSYN